MLYSSNWSYSQQRKGNDKRILVLTFQNTVTQESDRPKFVCSKGPVLPSNGNKNSIGKQNPTRHVNKEYVHLPRF